MCGFNVFCAVGLASDEHALKVFTGIQSPTLRLSLLLCRGVQYHESLNARNHDQDNIKKTISSKI